MARKHEARTRAVVGGFVILMAVLLFISLFLIGQSEGTWKSKVTIYTDFRTTTGLRKGSPVQLAGVEVGKVESIDFVNRQYLCDPLTEDVGRYGAGRTDNCDEYLFCAPTGYCADLEPYAAKGLHTPCLSSEDCNQDEVCVTGDFRRRGRRVNWNGPDGVCARYTTEHRRVQASLSVFADTLEIIRSDSRATVASNGVLGDQLVNITQGMREPLGEERRIQSTPSLYEDIQLFRERFDALTEKVDSSLSGISSLFSELNDERTIGAVKNTLEHLDEITRQISEGDGLVGALLNDQSFKEDVGVTLRKLRGTAVGVEQFVGTANGTLGKLDANFQPLVEDARKVADELRILLEDLRAPKNKSVISKLLRDEEGKIVADIEQILAQVEVITAKGASIMAKVDAGTGTMGKLVNDSKAHDDIVKLFGNLERNRTLKALIRLGMGQADDDARDPAKPPRSKAD